MEAIATKPGLRKPAGDLFSGVLTILFCCFLPAALRSQCPGRDQFYQQLTLIERSAQPDKARLEELYALERRYSACRLPQDSIYARMLHRMGVLQSFTGNLAAAIQSTQRSIRINTSGLPGSNRKLALTSYYNLGYFYLNEGFYSDALEAFDHCMAQGRDAQDSATLVKMASARQKSGFIHHQLGDDQKDVFETTLGLRSALRYRNNAVIVDLYNERAQAYASLQQIPAALADLDKALSYIGPDNYNALADNSKWRGYAMEINGNYPQAMHFYNEAIKARSKVPGAADLPKDYLDAGNVLLHQRTDRARARGYYRQALQLAREHADAVIAAKALNNLGLLSSRMSDAAAALLLYEQSLAEMLPAYKAGSNEHPVYSQINGSSKVFLYQVLGNRTECLLLLFKKTGQSSYLKACIQSAMLTDSVITGMRHEQTEELSKLHWLKDAKDFFTVALEACYLSGNHPLAFYFMEKSRSVLLNDKLNELGASALLPPAEAAKERRYQLSLLAAEQALWKLTPLDPVYPDQESRYLLAREQFEDFIGELQQAYPVYYQYKWASQMPSFTGFQQQLKKDGQSFVHYFVSDTCIYILATTPSSTQMVRQCVRSSPLLEEFLRICSDKQGLNHTYSQFAELSGKLYSLLFAPLRLPTKRVVICNDNFLLPFEALSTDKAGHRFLVDRYIFSYAYSARTGLKPANDRQGAGDCLLVAPGTYASYLNVGNLDESTSFLEASREYYSHTRLLIGKEASKANFIEEFSRYTIVNIYSHATADSSHAEPFLYLCDSVVRLSQLGMLDRPATQLVVLSACETSAGKRADGEGIYSLARGFAAAGIPAIASTLWKADAKATSEITSLFHRNLSMGLRKDEALQKAKQTFMQQHDREQQLPYYWANLILAGDTAPLQLTRPSHNIAWGFEGAAVILLAGGSVWMWKRKRAVKRK